MPHNMDTHDVYKEKIKLCLFRNMVGIPTKRLTFEVLMIQYLVCFRLGKDVMMFVASRMWKMMKVQNKNHTLILFGEHSKIKQMHYGRRRRFSVTKTILSFFRSEFTLPGDSTILQSSKIFHRFLSYNIFNYNSVWIENYDDVVCF